MKNQLRVSNVWNFTLLLTCLLSTFSVTDLRAQATFILPSPAYQDNYPTTVTNPQWQPRSCFSYRRASISGIDYDLYISGWIDANQEGHVIWRSSLTGSATPLTGGNIEFSVGSGIAVNDIAVGIVIDVSGSYTAIVTYNDVSPSGGSPGVVMNTYSVSLSSPTPPAPVTPIISSSATTTNQLYSQGGFYTRVSMDCMDRYSAIVWEEYDPTAFPLLRRIIKFLPGVNAIFGTPIELRGTGRNINPDVALLGNPTTGTSVHFVYYNPSSYEITESINSFNAAYTNSMFGPYSINPTIEDTKTLISPAIDPRPLLDCPSHYGVENWAYAYTTDNTTNDVYVRLVDYNTGGIPTDVNLTNGSLGNAPLSSWDNTWHTLSYGPPNAPTDIYIGWQTVDPSAPGSKNFICAEISEDGSALLSTVDYLLVPPFATFSPNGMYLSKNNESSFLYAVYSCKDNASTDLINHEMHAWSTPSSAFRSENKNLLKTYNISSWPNPFINSLSFDVSSALMDETIKATLTDVLGRTVFNMQLQGRDLNEIVNDYLPKMFPGSYWLKVSKPSLKYSQILPLVKTGNK